jgi:hypothetical protein
MTDSFGHVREDDIDTEWSWSDVRPVDGVRVYLTPDLSVWAIVDVEDAAFVTQWSWQFTWDRHKRKRYATRSPGAVAGGKRRKIYLHKLLLNHWGVPQPSEKHTIGDHEDGDSLNNRRRNLRWATHSENAKNRRRR